MIDLLPTEEQQQIAESAAAFLARELPVERLRTKGLSGDRALLATMAELGWLGLGLPESAGGVGYTLAEEVLLFIELGRFLVSPAVLAAVLGARIAAAAGNAALAREIAAGSVSPGIASPIRSAESGEAPASQFHLLDALHAPLIVVWNRERAALVSRSDMRTSSVLGMDGSLSLERATLEDAHAAATVSAAEEPIHRRANVLLAAMLVGISEATCMLAASYAKLREQFGQPIGAFQVIKHRCADMAVQAQAARSQMLFAALTARDGWPDADQQAAAAILIASHAALTNARATIQVHGAIGFTADCDVHHYLKRAHVLSWFAGGVRQHQQALLTPLDAATGAGQVAAGTRP